MYIFLFYDKIDALFICRFCTELTSDVLLLCRIDIFCLEFYTRILVHYECQRLFTTFLLVNYCRQKYLRYRFFDPRERTQDSSHSNFLHIFLFIRNLGPGIALHFLRIFPFWSPKSILAVS